MPAKGTAPKKGIKKKVQRRKVVDPFLKKEWYVIKVPTFLPCKTAKHRVGFSPANKAKAKKALDNRTFEINLADLQDAPFKNPYDRFRNKKFVFVTEEVFGPQLLTQFHGMEITRNFRCSLIRKERSMIQTRIDVRTKDSYVLRVTALAFTKRLLEQVKKHAYAKRSQQRQIRAKMNEKIRNAVTNSTLQDVIKKLSKGDIGKDIRKSCQLVYPLKECLIEKVKVMRKPKKDVANLMKMHDLTSAFDEVPESEDEEMKEKSGEEENKDETTTTEQKTEN